MIELGSGLTNPSRTTTKVARLPESLSAFDGPKLTDEDIALIDEAGAKEYHRQFVRWFTSHPELSHDIHFGISSRRASIHRKDECRLFAITVLVQATVVVASRRGVE